MSTSQPTDRTLYFAYGSNLSLQQMATRCPESRFLGVAILPHHRWQINSRGYANVINVTHTADSARHAPAVEGLCYLLSASDEAELDRNEGVSIGAYEKAELQVELCCAPVGLVGRDVVRIVADGSLGRVVSVSGGREREGQRRGRGEVTTALVYLSTVFIEDGSPREEYVRRISAGVADALVLGVSRKFVTAVIEPYLRTSAD
ncbi:uncharacterized protein L3040_002453 [Drepanopeziza brunnea f. sp. 'multigermtubi']|uniref:gamma-glutamylcyclotransferase n=1 Tax=Marssonina brunnea f. sp. multigermtubi (strain MB_m1) TaxID=1072389 RepID=K1X488_MARBU|nr:AIG2 family protein [Drepanopeziza brunnea f. sp. 'multigermtubi' MB_m1]EKD19862.1 AIG2 family protein [Drepanopeziza brunnea f. sp. 'multigermtubi' MB_m1]KAJ5050576.1 hypothetical protein L3040_002453 [Drepanopeziza brunnea f. sp. 'multigermtubi']